jgi:Xaa-Pro aminopeptidase
MQKNFISELVERRKELFSNSIFSSSLFFSGDSFPNINPNFYYFSGFEIDNSFLLLKKSKGILLVHKMNFEMAKANSFYKVKLIDKNFFSYLRKFLGKKSSLCTSELSFSEFQNLKKKTAIRFISIDQKVNSLRAKKSSSELSIMKKAKKIALEILEDFVPWEFNTEKEIANKLKIIALEKGVDVSFEPIVATGKNSSYPHHHSSDKKIEDFVLIDFGVRYKNYCSDLTRCYFKSKDKRFFSYEKCQNIFFDILDKNPQSPKELISYSQKLFEKEKLPQLIHAIGHGVGLEVHEFPRLYFESKDAFEEGNVIAIEPAAYFKNFGIRFEDMLFYKNGKWAIL